MTGHRIALGALAAVLVLGACGGASSSRRGRRARGNQTEEEQRAAQAGRCPTNGADLEPPTDTDTNGDGEPDVRRVFRRVGDPPLVRLVLQCRETDLNGDGTKDVVRFYNEEGRALREEADRDFDGTIDTVSIFQNGRIVRSESDTNADGRIDMKVYFDDDGTASRTERDLAGRSTPETWRADRWEYFENGRMVRMGTDVDGDGRVDRWDRDHENASQPVTSPVSTEGEGAAPSDGAPASGQRAPSGTTGTAPTGS